MIAERETMLGSTAAGAFGWISANSAFAGIEGHARIGSWRLGAGAELGTVRSAVRGGILAGVSPLTTSAFTLRAEKKLADEDSLLFSISQSLRVEAGRARLSVPVGRTKDGQVLRSSVSADLEPTGRQDRPHCAVAPVSGGRQRAASGRRLDIATRPRRLRRPRFQPPRRLAP